jgi:hypothetical protein
MRLFSGRKILIGVALLLLTLLGVLFLLRKETYDLNRNVRQVCLRILIYEELSLHRDDRYKFDFENKGYRISAFQAGEKSEWREVSTVAYAPSVESSPPGFTIEFFQGKAVASLWSEGRNISRSPLILRFTSVKNPARQGGIIFFEDGQWRPL